MRISSKSRPGAFLRLGLTLSLALCLVACSENYSEQAKANFASGAYAKALDLYRVMGQENWSEEDRLLQAIARMRQRGGEEAVATLKGLAQKAGPIGDRALRELGRHLGNFHDQGRLEVEFEPFVKGLPQRPAGLSAFATALAVAADRALPEISALLADALGQKRGAIAFHFTQRVLYALPELFESELERVVQAYEYEARRPLPRLTQLMRAQRARIDKAWDALRVASARDPNSFDVIGHLAAYATRAGDHESALTEARRLYFFDGATRQDVESPRVIAPVKFQTTVAALNLALEDPSPERGLAFAEEAWPEFNTLIRTALQATFAELLWRAGKIDRLNELTEEWIQKRSSEVAAQYYRGITLLNLGQAERARQHLAYAESREPSNARHKIWYGRALIACGDRERGTSILSDARDLARDDVDLAIEVSQLLVTKIGATAASKELVQLYGRLSPTRATERRRVLTALLPIWQLSVPEDRAIWRVAFEENPLNVRLGTVLVRDALSRGEVREAFGIGVRLWSYWRELPEAWLIAMLVAASAQDRALGDTALENCPRSEWDRMSPEDAAEMAILAALHRGEYKAALEAARTARESFPSDARFAPLMVRAVLAVKTPAEAHGEAVLLREVFPDDLSLLLAAADAAAQVPSRALEVQALVEAFKRGPLELGLVGRAIRAARASRDLEALKTLLPDYVERLPVSNPNQVELARGLSMIGEAEKAATHLESFIQSVSNPEWQKNARIALFEVHTAAKDILSSFAALRELKISGESELVQRILVLTAIAAGALEDAQRLGQSSRDPAVQARLSVLDPSAIAAAKLPLPPDVYANLQAKVDKGDEADVRKAVQDLLLAYPYRSLVLQGIRSRLTKAEHITLRREVEVGLELLRPGSVPRPPPDDPKRRGGRR